MSDLRFKDTPTDGLEPLSGSPPLPARILNAPYVRSKVYRTERVLVPGIGAAVAYTAADAFGTALSFPVPIEGTIAGVVFYDYDDEGITKELVLFEDPFTATADNAAFAVSDTDLHNCLGVISIDVYYNFGNNQIGIATPALSYVLTTGSTLYGQLVTRGADNIAAGAMPELMLVVV